MDKTRLFEFLATQEHTDLLALLSHAYDQMDIDQRRWVFGKLVPALPPAPVDGEQLLDAIKTFQDESLSGLYYAPFMIDSRNFTEIPEETDEWFEKLGDSLKDSCQLTQQGDHLRAVACFDILYALIGEMESGEEIVFADELGGWMIPGDEKTYIAAYMRALAATASPEEFTATAVPLIRRDSWQNFTAQSYASAVRAADAAQRIALDAAITQQKIRLPGEK